MDFELNIYGKLRYDHEKLKQRIESMEAVTLTNEFIDYKHIHKLYSSNDVLVLPYNQVTQCGPLLIAYSKCIPVICSDLPGFREYVDPERSGLIFGGSAEELANKMEEFVNNPQILLKFKDYIKTEVHKKFAMENLCETYIKNFEKSIG